MNIRKRILKVAKQRIIFTTHALDEMNNEEEIITVDEVKNVILHGEIIEEYPEDKRGHSCLLVGFPGTKRPVHVICAPKEEYLAVITTYVPEPAKWKNNFKTRKK